MMFSVLTIFLGAAANAAPGDHIRAGDAVFVPDIDIGVEYRSNVLRSDDNPAPGANLRVSPGVALEVDNPMNEFHLGGEWELRKFVFAGDDGSGRTASERIARLDQYNEFSLDAGLDALKQEVVGIQLANTAAARDNLTDSSLTNASYNTRIRNSLSGGIRISPGPALAIVPGGVWSYDDYRAVGSANRRYNQRNAYGPNLNTKWDFFPRTSFLLNASYMINDWAENQITADVDDSLNGGVIETRNSRHFKFETGLTGRFSTKIFLDVVAGYGFAVYDGADPAENLKGLNGLRTALQVRYAMTEGAQFSLGYRRDFTDSYFTDYIAYNNVFAQLQANIADFRPSAKFSARTEGYVGSLESRDDVMLRFDLNTAYDIQEWAAISSGFAWQQRASSDQEVEYDDFQFRLFGTFTY